MFWFFGLKISTSDDRDNGDADDWGDYHSTTHNNRSRMCSYVCMFGCLFFFSLLYPLLSPQRLENRGYEILIYRWEFELAQTMDREQLNCSSHTHTHTIVIH